MTKLSSLAGVLAAGTLVLGTVACGIGPATNDQATVTAAFYPLAWLSERVGGADVQVTNLTKPGAEPHDLELNPRQVAELGQAGLVVYIKGIQPAVDEAVAQQAATNSLDAASLVTTLPPAVGEVSFDPHIWLDPNRLAIVATGLGKRLAKADPAHAAGYRERAATTAAALTGLDAQMGAGLATCKSRTLVTSHTAFAYLADRYHLRQVGISGIDPDSDPSPARLKEVADTARREKVTTIFTEVLVSPKVAQVLASEVGATTAVLDPLEGKPERGDYVDAMRQNLNTLRTALGCQ